MFCLKVQDVFRTLYRISLLSSDEITEMHAAEIVSETYTIGNIIGLKTTVSRQFKKVYKKKRIPKNKDILQFKLNRNLILFIHYLQLDKTNKFLVRLHGE